MSNITKSSAQPDALTLAFAAMIAPIVREAVAAALAEHSDGAAPKPELLTQDAACAYYDVSPATWHRFRRNGLPCVFVGDSPRFRVADCDAWFEARTRERVTRGAGEGAP